MPGTIDKLSTGLALINIAMPGVVSLIATFSDGRQVDIKKLLDDTDARVEKTISEGESFLASTVEDAPGDEAGEGG